MKRIEFRFQSEAGELLDASDDIQRLLDSEDEISPALRALLLAMDDAITVAFTDPLAA